MESRQREQEYSVHKKKRCAVTLSICASSFHSPIGTFLPAEKLFAKASGDPNGSRRSGIKRSKPHKLSNSNARKERIGPIIASRDNL